MSNLRRGVDYPGITCVFVCHDGNGKILMHKRSVNCRDEKLRWDKGAGCLEFREELIDAVRREVRDEYLCDSLKIEYAQTTNVLRMNEETPTHWVAVVFAVLVDPKEAKTGEPHKMDDIGWFFPVNLPTPLHSMAERHLESVKHLI